MEELVVIDVVVVPNEEKHGTILFQESEVDPLIDVHSERPDIEPFRMEFLDSQRRMKRVFSEEIGFLCSLASDPDVQSGEQLVKGLCCENSHLLRDEFNEGFADGEPPLLKIALRLAKESEKRTLEKAG